MSRLENCDKAKTAMMVLVMFYHSIALWLRSGWFNQSPAEENLVFTFLAEWINTIPVFVFTFVSGYLFFYLRFESGKYASFLDFIQKKARRLLVPYIFVSAVWCVPFYMILFEADISDAMVNFAFGMNPAQLWYVLMLFVLFMLIYPLSNMIAKRDRWHNYTAAIVIYYVGLVIGELVSLPFQITQAIKHAAFFIIGMSFRKERTMLTLPWWLLLVINLAAFTVQFAITGMTGSIVKLIRVLLIPIVNMCSVLLVVAAVERFQHAKIWKTRVYAFLKTHSFTMYLFHQQVIYLVIVLLNGRVPSIVLAITSFAVSLVASGLISLILNRYKMTKLLIGK